MKKIKFTVIFILLSIIFVPFVGADFHQRGMYFVGLWQGVDPLDGSEVLRSITIDDYWKFQIKGTETYFSGCKSDRGIVEATGFIYNGVLITEEFTLKCFEDGKILFIDVEYVPDRKNGTLVEVIRGDFPPVILHRIDTRN
jgi:hypothetical protein